MKRIAITTLACLAAGAALAGDFSQSDLKRMGVFLSNFTELRILSIDDHFTDINTPDAMIRFGVLHNDANAYQRTVKQCKTPKCPYGAAVMDVEHVKNALARYVNFVPGMMPNAEVNGQRFHFDGKHYHYDPAAGEGVYHVRVESATRQADGNVQMKGVLFDPEDAKVTLGTVKALAAPHTWKGKPTWAILTLDARLKD